MFKISNLKMQNFLSVGNFPIILNLNREELVLIMGENLDLGSEGEGNKNGTGKTLILNGLSYGLFAWPISPIKKEHLINKTNGKNMLVTVEFEIDNKNYKIVRGLKPRILEFYENGVKKSDNTEAIDINDTSQGDNRETQKEIEKVLNMTHDMFCQIVVLNTYTTPFLFQKVADQRVIIEQLLGITLLSEKAEKLKEEIKLAKEDINKEDIRIKSSQAANKRIEDQIASLVRRQKLWNSDKETTLKNLESKIDFLSKIDIDDEVKVHSLWAEYNINKENRDKIQTQKSHFESSLNKDKKILEKLEKDLESLKTQSCHTCHQKLKDTQHKELMDKCQKEFIQVSLDIKNWNEKINSLEIISELSKPKEKVYNTLPEVYEHKNKLNLIIQQYEAKYNEIDTFTDQILEMQNSAIEVIDFSIMNSLSSFVDHQEFLLKLLVNKDSFIRKKIIEQNLSYLNNRLEFYLTELELPHSVIFQNDLDVNITELGRELSPGNLSRGEMARLQLGLSFAFRDVYESIYQKINFLGLDEMIDSGIDTAGSEAAIKLLRNMSREYGRDVWVISHKDELISKCNSLLIVTKQNGYSSFKFME